MSEPHPRHVADAERQLKNARARAAREAAPDPCRRIERWWAGDDWCSRCWRGIPPTHRCDRAVITARVTQTGKTYRLETK